MKSLEPHGAEPKACSQTAGSGRWWHRERQPAQVAPAATEVENGPVGGKALGARLPSGAVVAQDCR